MQKLLSLAKLESQNFEHRDGAIQIKSSKSHFLVRLHSVKDSRQTATLTVLDCGTQGSLGNQIPYLGYILNSMHRKQSKDLKKTQTSVQFNQILSNSKIAVLNFAERTPQFLKDVLTKDNILVFPVARNYNQTTLASVKIEEYLIEVGRVREA